MTAVDCSMLQLCSMAQWIHLAYGWSSTRNRRPFRAPEPQKCLHLPELGCVCSRWKLLGLFEVSTRNASIYRTGIQHMAIRTRTSAGILYLRSPRNEKYCIIKKIDPNKRKTQLILESLASQLVWINFFKTLSFLRRSLKSSENNHRFSLLCSDVQNYCNTHWMRK